MADVTINTVTKLLLEVGEACEQYQDKRLRGLKEPPYPVRRDSELRVRPRRRT
jgi:hypothetical protein